jgi:hypothetical protein
MGSRQPAVGGEPSIHPRPDPLPQRERGKRWRGAQGRAKGCLSTAHGWLPAACCLLLALAACAPLGNTPELKVRTPAPGSGPPVAAAATLTPPPVVLPTLTPTPLPPQPNRRLNEPIELGQLTVTVTRAQRYRSAERCPADSQAVEIDYRVTNRSRETIGVDFIDSVLEDRQGRMLRPANIHLREVRDVLPGFTERMTYLFCILPDSSGLALLVAPAAYRGFERQPGPRATVDLEPEGVVLPIIPRATPAPTQPPR